MEELIYAIIVLFVAIILTLALSPIIHSGINNDITSSNQDGFTLAAGVLSVLSIMVDLHGLLTIIIEITATFYLVYKSI